jgi:hypothetical protein
MNVSVLDRLWRSRLVLACVVVLSAGVLVPRTVLADREASQARLAPIAYTWAPQETGPFGSGHYVEVSGWVTSRCCAEGLPWSPWYAVATAPLVPGHSITDFSYELRGDKNVACHAPTGPDGGLVEELHGHVSECRVLTDTAGRKVVQFRVRSTSACWDRGCGNPVVTRAQLVLSYDVQ